MQPRIDAWGLWGSLPLGFVLALAFCPVSAASFFVSLLAMLAASDFAGSAAVGLWHRHRIAGGPLRDVDRGGRPVDGVPVRSTRASRMVGPSCNCRDTDRCRNSLLPEVRFRGLAVLGPLAAIPPRRLERPGPSAPRQLRTGRVTATEHFRRGRSGFVERKLGQSPTYSFAGR